VIGDVDRGPFRGRRVGPYRLEEVLGKGGMGTVYLARQDEPVQRRVALKVLKAGAVSPTAVARFEAERQALALMNHQSIATVFEAGTTSEGLPYFAMEVVDGKPVTTYCDSCRLGLGDRLALFLDVCDAIQHAHQKMVIHRDIKPSNVLVTLRDGRAVPKVIDFGISKGTQEPLVHHEGLETQDGSPIGTPIYMSPEQIEGTGIDARVDVYALGVLLYELISGALPFEVSGSQPYQIMMRIIGEEPVPPSQRIGTLGERAHEIAASRGLEVAGLRRMLRGDLDRIVMTAMAKDRDLRYASVADLKADVVRYLNHEAVLAMPPTVAYKLAKFVRRYRGTVVTASLLFLSLIVGLTATSKAMINARRARDQARQAERRANATVEYLRKVLSSVDPGVDGRQVRVVDLLAKASEMITSDLADQPETEAAVRKTIGLALLELGMFEESGPELERAVAIQRRLLGEDDPETLHTINALGRLSYKLGMYRQAAAIHRAVLEKQQSLLGPEDPTTLWTMYHLAKALDKQGHITEAEQLYRRNVEIRRKVLGPEHEHTLVAINSLSLFLGASGRPVEAEQLQRENLERLTRTMGPHHPDTLRARANLVEILNRQQRWPEAEQLAHETLLLENQVLGDDHPETLGTSHQLAVAMYEQGRFRDAEALLRRVLAQRAAKLGPDHPDTLETSLYLGLALYRLGHRAEAERLATSSLEAISQDLPADHWRPARLRVAMAECLAELGERTRATRLLEEALAALEAAEHADAEEVGETLDRLRREARKLDRAGPATAAPS
jgi:non-specific serine/threonine protein kinase/serine/threonine-protein kinase